MSEPRCPGAWEKGGCGVVTGWIRGHVTLCLRCTETELGVKLKVLQERWGAQRAKGRTRKWSMFASGARERGVAADQSYRKRRA